MVDSLKINLEWQRNLAPYIVLSGTPASVLELSG